MLSLLTAKTPSPEVEPVVGDPGALTLALSIVRALRRGQDAMFERRCSLARRGGGTGVN